LQALCHENTVIITAFSCLLQIPHTEEEWKAVTEEFEKQWNFPHCVGALDGKLVGIEPPPNSGSLYYNYKQYHSIVLMALVDAQHRFLFVDIGCYGMVSDGGVFNICGLSSGLECNTLNISSPSPILHHT